MLAEMKHRKSQEQRKQDESVRDIRYFIGHQANLRMLTSVVGRLGSHPAQHLHNVDGHGNQDAAGAPMVLTQCGTMPYRVE
jgi:3-oxoacyl-[acyl-carrier-protein] synthase III